MNIYKNDDRGNWEQVGSLTWSDSEYDVETENGEVERIIERVNDAETWDTAEPTVIENAPVAEGVEDLDEGRALSLVKTYLSQNGFGLANEDELNNDDAS